MARRRAPSPPSTPPVDPSAEADVADEGGELSVAAQAALLATPAAGRFDPEELAGTVEFLELLDECSPLERARLGFKFSVYVAEGPRAYLPDSDWGDTVPTEAAIAERYGPGTYRVKVARRRRGQGGGWSGDILVRIARPRSPDAPAPLPTSGDGRAFDLLERMLAARLGAADDDGAGPALPPGAVVLDAAGVDRLTATIEAAVKAKDASMLPEWLQPLAAKFIADAFSGGAAPGAGAAAAAAAPEVTS